jgi:tripartite-type tricarboxylate transporter receptor subunit TctC
MSKALYVGALLLVVAGLGVQAQSPATGQPQNWPDRPIRWIVPYPAGGGTDVVARAVADQLSQSLHQPVIVDNRAGGNTIIGTTTVAQAAPDGYTIGLITDAFSANVALGRQMPYESDRDFAPIVQLTRVPFVLIVNPKLVPMRTLPELISYAKGHPGWLTAATLGPGSPHETAMSWFKSMTGIDMLIVPYRGGNLAMTDLIGGQVKAMMSGAPAAEEIIKSGKAFPIAMASAARLQSMPDVRTFAEQGYPEFTFASWFGVVAPGKLPAELQQRLNTEINRTLETKSVRDRIVTAGGEVIGGPPERLKETIRESTDRYRKILALTGSKPN